MVPYSAATVHAILKQTPPIGPHTDKDRGCGLAWIKLGETIPAISMNNIEEFISEDFESVFAEKRKPNPVINVSGKAILSDFIKGQELKQYQ